MGRGIGSGLGKTSGKGHKGQKSRSGVAVSTFEGLKKKSQDLPLTVDYQLGRAHRLLGQYKASIDALETVLKEKPTMLDAQMEAAQAYEDWAAVVPPKFAGKAYESALNGARKNAKGEKC